MNSLSRSGRVAVLIPLYRPLLSDAEEFSLRNTLAVLKQHDIFAIGPEKLGVFLRRYTQEIGQIHLSLYRDEFFSSIDGYNKLLMSKHFYQSFAQYEYILILQTDALVFSDQLDSWCGQGYSYVGAPWFVGFDKPKKPLTFLGVGNGGFSLRKVEDFIRFLSKPRWVPNKLRCENTSEPGFQQILHKYIFAYNFSPLLPRINEDGFWGLLVSQQYPSFTVPPIEVALQFAFDTEPRYLYELNHQQLPFGCHAWERYDKAFWRETLTIRGMSLP